MFECIFRLLLLLYRLPVNNNHSGPSRTTVAGGKSDPTRANAATAAARTKHACTYRTNPALAILI